MWSDPATIGRWVPAWLAPWLIRLGAYIQNIGRECYHQCQDDKQAAIKAKLEKVYGPDEA